MENIKKAIKHFECVKSDAVAVLDSGFGTKPNESDITYKNRKLYAELAISALEKQIPKKPIIKKSVKVSAFMLRCPNCELVLQSDSPCCRYCGQSLDWSAVDE